MSLLQLRESNPLLSTYEDDELPLLQAAAIRRGIEPLVSSLTGKHLNQMTHEPVPGIGGPTRGRRFIRQTTAAHVEGLEPSFWRFGGACPSR